MELFSLLVVVLMGFLLIRNLQVCRFRNKVVDRVFSNSLDARFLLTYYEQVSYEEMLFKFWKPLRSFYEGTPLEGEV